MILDNILSLNLFLNSSDIKLKPSSFADFLRALFAKHSAKLNSSSDKTYMQ